MTIYYIAQPDTNEILALDATTTVQLDETGKTTALPLETGEEVTDHYINGNTKVSMSGVISTAKSSGNSTNKSPEDYIRDIRNLKKSGKPFSVFFSDKLNPLTNCVFTSLSFSQSIRNGFNGASSSYKVTFAVKQVRFVQAARLVVEPTVQVADDTSEKNTSGKSTQEAADNRNITTGTQRLDIGLKMTGLR